MAMDTVKKRASVSGVVWADGALDLDDMQTISGVYGGGRFLGTSDVVTLISAAVILTGPEIIQVKKRN